MWVFLFFFFLPHDIIIIIYICNIGNTHTHLPRDEINEALFIGHTNIIIIIITVIYVYVFIRSCDGRERAVKKKKKIAK